MKKIITLFFLILTNVLLAQAPNKMTYQSVIRNSQNELLNNSNVGVRIQILQGDENGTSVYTEYHTKSTNSNGLLTLNIGEGTTTNSFNDINWAEGPYFIEIGIDSNGGNSYNIITSNELMSVPYALYAANAPVGPAGPQGPQGEQGPQGLIGLTGEIGPEGPVGLTGPAGAKGETGDQGPVGLTGPAGAKGETGDQGPVGLTGPAGAKGETGDQGPIGLTGPAGAKGETGDQGPIGLTGPAGAKGETGDQGPIGLTGPAGAKGETGNQGPIGLTGPVGAKGETGDQGPVGLTGPTGAKGETGDQGPVGLTGPAGAKGETGDQGPIGLTGPTGATGPLVNGTAGNILYHNGITWVALNSGTQGQILQSNGTNAPTWKSAKVCYADRDGDGKGDKYSRFVTYDNTCPTGFVEDDTDCDDNNPTNTVAVPIATAATNRLATSVITNWTSVSYATHYLLDVATDSNFSNMLSGYNGLNVGNEITYMITNLDACTQYYYRVRAVSVCATSANSTTINISGYNCVSFNFTGGEQTFTVPEGVTTLRVQLWGAKGGTYAVGIPAGHKPGGLGGYVSGNLNVTLGQVLTVIVGGAGNNSGYSNGGYNGGGQNFSTGGGGGGATTLKQANTEIARAGGGGGAAYNGGGGAGGAGNGTRGGDFISTDGINGGGGGAGSDIPAEGGASLSGSLTAPIIITHGVNDGNGKVQISW